MEQSSCNLIELDSCLDENSILRYIEDRFLKNEIYTYAGKTIIVVNPFQEIENLHGLNEIKRYNANAIYGLPPHVYALAHKAVEDVRCSKNQSLIISGISGAGKTRTSLNLIDFFCKTVESTDVVKRNILNSGPILESFGNAKTTQNSNSSRFCKYTQLYYDANVKLVGGRVHYHSLEISRVSCQVPGQSNFHIFYSLLFGGPEALLEQLLINNIKQKFRILPDQECQARSILKHKKNFEVIDSTLTQFGLLEGQKLALYKVIAAILHLGNVDFHDQSEGCQIMETEKKSLHITANLLGIEAEALAESIMTRSINEKGGAPNLKITIPLGRENAKKAKETLSRLLFEHLFRQVLTIVNDSISFKTSNSSVGILDIAGFECLNTNTFDQLCINYVNERFQYIFVERMLIEEKKWYDKDGIDVPLVPFFDNHKILELFDHRVWGIFASLNDICKLDGLSIKNFIIKLKEWKHPDISFSERVRKNNDPSNSNEFTIRHFACDVRYQTDDFIEKNCLVLSPSLIPIIQNALQPITATKIKIGEYKCFKTTVSELKTDLKNLIGVIEKNETQFIRCIKPNSTGIVQIFDQEFALKQLRSSSIISYVNLMRFGFPKRLRIDQIYSSFKPKYDLWKGLSSDKKQFCSNLLLSNGFDFTDFKFGTEFIFLREKCSALYNKFTSPDPEFIEKSVRNLKKFAIRLEWQKIYEKLLKYVDKEPVILNENEDLGKSEEQNPIGSVEHTFRNKPVTRSEDTVFNESVGDESLPKSIESVQHNAGQILFETNHQTKVTKKATTTFHPSFKRSKVEKKPPNSLRYDLSAGHFAEFDEKVNASRCKVEDCKKRTHIFCIKCNVHLCFVPKRNCFKKFHQLSIND